MSQRKRFGNCAVCSAFTGDWFKSGSGDVPRMWLCQLHFKEFKRYEKIPEQNGGADFD